MEEVIKGLIKGQIESYKRQPEGSSAKKGEIYNEIKRLVNDLSCQQPLPKGRGLSMSN